MCPLNGTEENNNVVLSTDTLVSLQSIEVIADCHKVVAKAAMSRR